VHGPLTPSFLLRLARIVTGCFLGEHREHAGIPRPQTNTIAALYFVTDIETMTGGAQIGAGAASQTFTVNRIPKRIIKILVQNWFDFMRRNFRCNCCFGFGRNVIFLGLGGSICFCITKILGQFFSLGGNKLGKIVRANICQENI
jgi:hypothetical protein